MGNYISLFLFLLIPFISPLQGGEVQDRALLEQIYRKATSSDSPIKTEFKLRVLKNGKETGDFILGEMNLSGRNIQLYNVYFKRLDEGKYGVFVEWSPRDSRNSEIYISSDRTRFSFKRNYSLFLEHIIFFNGVVKSEEEYIKWVQEGGNESELYTVRGRGYIKDDRGNVDSLEFVPVRELELPKAIFSWEF